MRARAHDVWGCGTLPALQAMHVSLPRWLAEPETHRIGEPESKDGQTIEVNRVCVPSSVYSPFQFGHHLALDRMQTHVVTPLHTVDSLELPIAFFSAHLFALLVSSESDLGKRAPCGPCKFTFKSLDLESALICTKLCSCAQKCARCATYEFANIITLKSVGFHESAHFA